MPAPPQPLPQKLLALLVAVPAIGVVAPWPYRLQCALGVVAIVLILAFARTRAGVAAMKSERRADVYTKIARIRAARKARFGGRSR